MNPYPHISALIRRARWHASLRMRISPDADVLAELDAYGWIGVLTAVRAGHRGAAASARDVRIVALLVAGFNNEGIGLELGIDAHSVAHYRRQIQNRLLTAARGCAIIGVSDEAG